MKEYVGTWETRPTDKSLEDRNVVNSELGFIFLIVCWENFN